LPLRCGSCRAGWTPLHLTVRMHQDANATDDGRVVAAAPVYIKVHSMGEFIFDNSWYVARPFSDPFPDSPFPPCAETAIAGKGCSRTSCLILCCVKSVNLQLTPPVRWLRASACERLGLEYYPKILCAVPFTPAGSAR
jgi:hypothetical protein